MSAIDLDVDFLVIGGGIAGMTAASRAAASGLRVAVVEMAPRIGGSAAMSGGVLWQPKSRETLLAVDPHGDSQLVDLFFERFPDALEWVRRLDVEVGQPTDVLGYGVGRIIDIIGYLKACQRQVAKAGGWVVTSASAETLVLDGDDVVGAVVSDREGTYEVRAHTTLLATGGFQGDAERRARHLGPSAARMLVRSNATSCGRGLALGLAVGAALSPHMDGFYGHLMISPLRSLSENDFVRLSQWYCQQSVVLSLTGERIADESRGYALCAQAAVRQPEPRVAVLFDEQIRANLATGPTGVQGLEAVDRLAEARSVGGRVAVAGTWAELTDAIGEWGFERARGLETIQHYNDAMATGRELVGPPRNAYRRSLDVGPFYAVEAQPAITFTMGGIRIDRDTRVLRADGTNIAGLLAAGADTGGTFAHGYGGGLALGSVHGTVAAEQACWRAASRV